MTLNLTEMILVKSQNRRKIDIIRKEVIESFKESGFTFDMKTNSKVTFLCYINHPKRYRFSLLEAKYCTALYKDTIHRLFFNLPSRLRL